MRKAADSLSEQPVFGLRFKPHAFWMRIRVANHSTVVLVLCGGSGEMFCKWQVYSLSRFELIWTASCLKVESVCGVELWNAVVLAYNDKMQRLDVLLRRRHDCCHSWNSWHADTISSTARNMSTTYSLPQLPTQFLCWSSFKRYQERLASQCHQVSNS